MRYLILLLISTFFIGCSTTGKLSLRDKAIEEIKRTEKEFESYVKEYGITEGFYKFAADDAVLNHGVILIKGKEAIKLFYLSKNSDKNKLEWNAEFIDAAESGELGYTYGSYIYLVPDSSGQFTKYTGVFHTVWKKQKDGNWKFVWD
jgi:ketosteroid isomerase-like protein